nr:hypothetical protein [Marinicella sp. W31]MDC2875585.1 hypothetical protein [Marinicella sp. W31]
MTRPQAVRPFISTREIRFERPYRSRLHHRNGGRTGKVATTMAGEQSSGTFTKVPGETPELLERAGARVENLEILETVAEPSLPGARQGAPIRRARVTLSWPMATVGLSVPHLSIVIGGNLFELKDFSGLRLDDIRLPEAFLAAGPGPRFGIEGTRRLSGVHGRPLIGTIVKPSVGLPPNRRPTLPKPWPRPGSISSRTMNCRPTAPPVPSMSAWMP